MSGESLTGDQCYRARSDTSVHARQTCALTQERHHRTILVSLVNACVGSGCWDMGIWTTLMTNYSSEADSETDTWHSLLPLTSPCDSIDGQRRVWVWLHEHHDAECRCCWSSVSWSKLSPGNGSCWISSPRVRPASSSPSSHAGKDCQPLKTNGDVSVQSLDFRHPKQTNCFPSEGGNWKIVTEQRKHVNLQLCLARSRSDRL